MIVRATDTHDIQTALAYSELMALVVVKVMMANWWSGATWSQGRWLAKSRHSRHDTVKISKVVVGVRRDAKLSMQPSEVILGVKGQAECVPVYLHM